MDKISIGLDFGTHQTKICAQITPDEGRGEPKYEFFTFTDLQGKKQYILPSVIQIKADGRLSYGYTPKPDKEEPQYHFDSEGLASFDIAKTTEDLFKKYSTQKNTIEDKAIIEKMLRKRLDKETSIIDAKEQDAKLRFKRELQGYYRGLNIYKYFKQASLSELCWEEDIPSDLLCIWYLSYIIFLLEKKYGRNFTVNMGVPADSNNYTARRIKAKKLLISAFNLVEEVYNNDMDAFLNETYEDLFLNTAIVDFSQKDEKNEDYFYVNVFPEAFSSLICLTSKGKISNGMSLMVDIGGGTTDISFFTIKNNNPNIYKYWSLAKGLNYLFEESINYYIYKNFAKGVDETVLDNYINKRESLVQKFVEQLFIQLKAKTSIDSIRLTEALSDRVLVYTGGGSAYYQLTSQISYFSDIKIIDPSMWREENIGNRKEINPLCHILATSYGLSLCENESQVKLEPISDIFNGLPNEPKGKYDKKEMVGKESC